MAATVGTSLVTDAAERAMTDSESRGGNVAQIRRGSAQSTDGYYGSVGTIGRSQVDVLRADMRLAAAVSRKGRIGNIVVLEIALDSLNVMSTMYREYSRAELLDRVTRVIARHHHALRKKQISRVTATLGEPASQPAPTHGSISYRDLLAIDPAMDTSSNPNIFVRKGCIVVSMPPLHALITADHLFLFPEPGADGDLQPVLEHMHHYHATDDKSATCFATPLGAPTPSDAPTHLQSPTPVDIVVHPSPPTKDDVHNDHPPVTHVQGSFEFEALSILLATAETTRDKELARLTETCEKVTNVRKAGEAQVEKLQHAEDAARDYISSLEAVIKTVEALRSASDDIEALVLSYQRPRGTEYEAPQFLASSAPNSISETPHVKDPRDSSEVARVAYQTECVRFEELLEWYLAESENALSDARLLVAKLDGERKRLTLVLANNRNTLLKINIAIQIVTAMFGACSMVSGFFGTIVYRIHFVSLMGLVGGRRATRMNLDNGICGPDGCQSIEGQVDHGHGAFVKVSVVTSAIVIVLGMIVAVLVRKLTH